jgi:hypothetical protein
MDEAITESKLNLADGERDLYGSNVPDRKLIYPAWKRFALQLEGSTQR